MPSRKRKISWWLLFLFLLFPLLSSIFQSASSHQVSQDNEEFVIKQLQLNSASQDRPRGSSIEFTRKFTMLGNSTLQQHRIQAPSSSLVAYSSSSDLIQHKIRQQQARLSHQYQQQQQNHFIQQQQPQYQQKRDLLEKICIGTSNRLSVQHNKSEHYQNLLERYQNCTYVIGNLEITWLSRDDMKNGADLSFLESIREITGYLLIAYVDVDRIRMPNLQIIRGRDLFKLNHNQKQHERQHEQHDSERVEEFALILIENELKQLELPNLREILAGSFGSYNNRNLCHIRTINWDEILNQYTSVFVYDGTEPKCPACDPSCQGYCWGPGAEMCQKFSKTTCSRVCGQNGRCFGPSDSECCHSFCAGGCTGHNQTDCLVCRNFYDDGACVQECPLMMRYNPSKFLWEPNPLGKYAFGATCVRECPENMLRDSGACVRTCPPNKRSFNGECVPCGGPCPKNCQGVEVVHSGNIDQLINCTVIEGSITILDESFTGYTEYLSPVDKNNSTASAKSNGQHQQQPLVITSNSSSSNSSSTVQNNITNIIRHKPMHPSRLEVFKTLREITGYLNIKAKHPDFKDLSCFTNLRTIDGRQTTDMFHTLSITRTSLMSLNLRSLRKVRGGKISIEDNPDLCFADTIDWRQIDISRRISDDVTLRNNAETAHCRASGLQCNEQCARDGCWGPGPDECLSCNNYKVEDYCVANCTATEQLFGFLSYKDPSQARTCKRCHAECREGCFGTEARHCQLCKNVKDGPYCVPECPSHKFNNQTDGTCQECDKSCGPDGCTGPSDRLGEGGCNSCAKAIIKPAVLSVPFAAYSLVQPGGGDTTNSTALAASNLQAQQPFEVQCIRVEEPCPEGYYQEYVLGSMQPDGSPLKTSSGRPVCRKCHHRCKRCIGMGTHRTVCECAKYVAGEQCEDFCPRDYYADEETRQCIKCSPECNGCTGPTEADCISCRVYRIYYESNHQQLENLANNLQLIDVESSISSTAFGNQSSSSTPRLRFNCTAQCPSDKPHRISESNMLDPYCSDDPAGFHDHHVESSLLVSLGSSSILVMLVVVSAALMVCLSVHRLQMEKDKKFKLTMHLSGIEDVEPLTPSNLKPNLAPLRSIKECELRKGHQLGSGFGGTVYQGLWFPEGQEQHKPRAVAIKVLRDNGQNKEFLDEAYIMASVNHPNLVRLLAVCMTPSHLMLVTQLMPLGCLLDYVHKHKRVIGSKSLLEWGKQIARGMAYLEENRMVHRDLALRNVLLHISGRALISDFGLAKLLELDQSEYHSGEGRLPIKWLAPECLRERKFTHKSDVWAFGVTVWELVTFGQRPFEDYETRDVPLAIEKGARLHQPGYVTTELYKVMYACWFYNPEDRPDFRQLALQFVKFARDPERFIVLDRSAVKGIKLLCNNKQILDENNNNSTVSSIEDDANGQFDEANSEPDDELANSDDEGTEPLSALLTADQGQSPTTTTSFSQQATPTVLLNHQPDLTPSTHNRLNTMFGFEIRRYRQSRSSESESNSLRQQELHQQHIHHLHHVHQSTGLKVANSGSFNDANNNHTLMRDNNHSHRMNGHPRQPTHSVTSCWSVHQRSEQPTDVYDYLLPSPCADELGNAFGNEIFYEERRNCKTLPRTSVTNEEYFLTQANYVNEQHLKPLSPKLNDSSEDIPQSLV